MTTIFVVEGSSGEYSDRYEWPIAAYESEDAAKAHVTAADEWARANKCSGDLDRIPYNSHEREHLRNPFDPSMSVDYTGVWYRYYSVPLVRSLAELTEVAK